MQNCSTKNISTGFWLSFQIHGDGSELFEYGLPAPTYYDRVNNSSYGAYWLLDGYFHTKQGREYLNDTISKLSNVFKIQRRLGSPKDLLFEDAIKLVRFSGLPSLRTRAQQSPNSAKYEDSVFWAIKLEAIRTIRSTGWLDHSILESWAFGVFLVGKHVKDKSTLRAKCRSIFEWYEARNWKIDDRNFTMSRSEAGRVTAAKNAAANEAKVRAAITSLQFLQEKITVSSVARSAGVSRPTAQKYLEKINAPELLEEMGEMDEIEEIFMDDPERLAVYRAKKEKLA